MNSPNSDTEIQDQRLVENNIVDVPTNSQKQSSAKHIGKYQNPESDEERVFTDDNSINLKCLKDAQSSTCNQNVSGIEKQVDDGKKFATKVESKVEGNDNGGNICGLDVVDKDQDVQNVTNAKEYSNHDDFSPPTIGEYITHRVTFPVTDKYVHEESTSDVVLEFVDGVYNQFVQAMQICTDLSVTNWISAVTCFLHKVNDLCINAYTKTEPLSTAEEIGCAMHMVNNLSLHQFERLTTTGINVNNGRNIFVNTCFLLANLETARAFSTNLDDNDDDWYNTKFDMIRKFLILKTSDKAFTKLRDNQEWLMKCATVLGDYHVLEQIEKEQRTLLENYQVQSCSTAHREKNRVILPNLLLLVEADGNIYDRARDPPGQRSVYIPPGDANMESYRLSTFIKYPQEVPVNPRHLASAGFYYTGYKDRVKCFSCGLCCENWVFGDDVRSAQWHRSDCAFVQGRDSGNVPIGGGGLARFMMPARSQEGIHAMDTGPPSSNFTASSGTAKQVLNAQTPSAGSVLLSHSAGSNQSTPMQTARPVTRNQPLFQIVEFATIPSAYHENFLKNLDLRKESERARTFEHWPSETPTVYPADLARSAFFYLGNLDRVQCFSCGGVLRNWNYGDNVQAEHRRHFPHCKMCQGSETRNVQLTPDERAAVPSQQTVFHEPPDPSEDQSRDLRNMFQCQYPVSPHMRNEDTRFESFDHRWPESQVNATPRQIARAGFFFLGTKLLKIKSYTNTLSIFGLFTEVIFNLFKFQLLLY
uniref:ZF(RING)-14 zinc finger protein n=1 Tax=Phallusia mammillata TaxID=59560 RepID=A0A6F9D7T1_9ASCI|nr:ZF(RING)-14 zinc finger protein [Phallusia mammillata]